MSHLPTDKVLRTPSVGFFLFKIGFQIMKSKFEIIFAVFPTLDKNPCANAEHCQIRDRRHDDTFNHFSHLLNISSTVIPIRSHISLMMYNDGVTNRSFSYFQIVISQYPASFPNSSCVRFRDSLKLRICSPIVTSIRPPS